MINTIYLLTNKITNKCYVGQTTRTLKERMGKDGNGYFNSVKLYNSIKKHGVENFEYKALAYTECHIKANECETFL